MWVNFLFFFFFIFLLHKDCLTKAFSDSFTFFAECHAIWTQEMQLFCMQRYYRPPDRNNNKMQDSYWGHDVQKIEF